VVLWRPGSAHESTSFVQILGDGGLLSVSGPIDHRIAAIAQAQRGRGTRAQFLAAGVTSSAIHRRRKSGNLIDEHPGVYAVGHQAEIPLGAETSALLVCGMQSLLSNHSAAATMWGFRPGTARPIHVTVPYTAQTGRPKGVIVHRSAILEPRDACVHNGLPVTSPARTLLDIAATLPDRDTAQALEQGLAKRLLTKADVDDILSRAGRHPGAATLARITGAPCGSTLTESHAEQRLLELIRQAQLPAPETQQYLLGYRVDLLWRDLKLVVEVDGYRYHSTPAAFERDRRRDAQLQAAGYTVIRIAASQIEDEPFAVIARLAQNILARAAAGGY
jgi:very-short-patch-repair endonuclease